MKIISRTSATLVLSWLVLFVGVSSDNSAEESQTDVTTPHPKTKFILEIRITNRIYNDSLDDQESVEYKTLRQEVEQLFFEVYGATSLEYLGTDEITFRNGSVIVSAQLLFGTTMNLLLERNFFYSMYKQIPSPTLEIDLDYDASINSVDMFAVETTTESTVITTVKPQTKFYMEIRITNRIFNDTLEDQESEEYKTLRQDVEDLFSDVYSPTPLQYVSTEQITFRNGSVIAGAEVLFGTTMINPMLEKSLFVTRYGELQSPKLEVDINYVINEMPTQQPVEDMTTPTPLPTTPTTTTPTTATPSTATPTAATPSTATPSTAIPTTSMPSTTTPLTSRDPTSTHPSTHTTSLGSTLANTTHSSTSLSPSPTPLNTTLHPDTNTTHSPINSTVTNSTTTASPNATLSATSNHNNTSSIPTSSFVSTASPSTPAAGVPGWGIALLVLAAISLLLLIILLIVLLVMCCCWPKETVVKEPAMTPPMYFNPEIPMYSTHSTIDAANSKQADVREKPPKNRTGMYVVNK